MCPQILGLQSNRRSADSYPNRNSNPISGTRSTEYGMAQQTALAAAPTTTASAGRRPYNQTAVASTRRAKQTNQRLHTTSRGIRGVRNVRYQRGQPGTTTTTPPKPAGAAGGSGGEAGTKSAAPRKWPSGCIQAQAQAQAQ